MNFNRIVQKFNRRLLWAIRLLNNRGELYISNKWSNIEYFHVFWYVEFFFVSHVAFLLFHLLCQVCGGFFESTLSYVKNFIFSVLLSASLSEICHFAYATFHFVYACFFVFDCGLSVIINFVLFYNWFCILFLCSFF